MVGGQATGLTGGWGSVPEPEGELLEMVVAAQVETSIAPAPGRPAEAPAPHREAGLSDGDVIEFYRVMLVSRLISERAFKLAMQGVLDVSIPSDGHEAAQVGSIAALRPRDPVYLFYRSVPAAYARGMTARELMLDYFGRREGPSSGGKNLPGHWASRRLHLMTHSGSVGTHLPHAVGSALATRYRGEDDVSVCYFGEGAVSKGDFHEGLSFASIHRLPVIFFCENNEVSISVPFSRQSPVPSVASRAAGYNVAAEAVDGSDVVAVYAATRRAVERARCGGGPTLLEARVPRLGQHTSQVGESRSPEDLAAARSRDPLPRLATYLRQHGLLDDARDTGLRAAVEAEVDDAIQFARKAPPPPVEAAYSDVFTA